MKSGTGDDPFDGDGGEEEETEATLDDHEDEVDAERPTRDVEQPSVTDRDDLPYVLVRQTVKEDREMVQFFLREQFVDGERALRRDVEDLLETDVSKIDLREAAYAVAQERPEAVATVLREWGYEYR